MELDLTADGGDTYRINLIDEFNLPVVVSPMEGSNGLCKDASCKSIINIIFRAGLKVRYGLWNVGCKSAC